MKRLLTLLLVCSSIWTGNILRAFADPTSTGCNACDGVQKLYSDDNVQVSADLCDFEIKFKLDTASYIAFGFPKQYGADGWPAELVLCNPENGNTSIEEFYGKQNSVPIDKLNVHEIECDENGLSFDLYLPIKHLRGSGTVLDLVVMDSKTNVQQFNLTI